ncbi:hypothetical protein [Kitasatospora sp. NPDC056181]|uniref:hypothetical protein n=1 Tax=Kitasatospora sp. NPDC056181 TaxID=3345737 RepID=UPI0035D71471
MSDTQPADAADAAQARAPEGAELPIAFAVFHDLNAQRYTDYAFAHLPDESVVRDLVDDVFVALAERWDRVLTRPSPAAYAWALLRRVVEAECARRDEHLALIEEAAFAYALIERGKRILELVDDSMVDASVSASAWPARSRTCPAVSTTSSCCGSWPATNRPRSPRSWASRTSPSAP